MNLQKMLYALVVIFCVSVPTGMVLAASVQNTIKYPDQDVPALISAASKPYRAKFRVTPQLATQQMDAMLVQQYLAKGTITAERNGHLKQLYVQAVTLIMNGYPIAGGALVAIARLDPAYPDSPVGPGISHFVDAMLAPTDEDRDLTLFYERAKSAQMRLQSLRQELRLVAQLRVIGAIYHDPIAVAAGKAGLQAKGASPAEMKQVQKALVK